MVKKVCRATMIGMLTLSFVVCNGAVSAGPLEDGDKAVRYGDYTTALRLWRPLAERGDAEAQFRLGSLYELGESGMQDYV